MKAINFISNFANKNFALITIIIAIIAFNLPNQFSWLNSYISILLGIVMFGMGLTLKPVDFKIALTKPKPVIAGVVLQYTVMPLIAFTIAKLLDLPPELAAGIILVGCVPGGTASNVMVYLAKGNVPLSVAMTSISTMLAPIMTPAILYLLAGHWMPVNPFQMFWSIIQVIIIPIILGIIIQNYFPVAVEKSVQALPFISVVAVSGVVAAVVSGNTENIASAGILVFITVILHNISGLFLGYIIATLLRLDADTRRTISFEVGIQNAGLGVSLANTHFPTMPLTALPGAVAVVTHVINGSILATFWSRKPLKQDKLQAKEVVEMKKTV